MLDMKALTAKSSSSRIPALSKAATRPVHNTVLLSDIVAAFQQKRSNDTGVDQRRTYVPEQKQATLWDKTLVDSESQGLEIPGFLQLNEVTDYVPGKSFAAGGGGSLYRGHMTVHALNGFKVVIKKMKGASLPAFRQEVALMWMFKDHENMVKLIGYDESQLAILMPEYPLGSLDHFIATKNYNLGIASSIAFDIAKGLAAMHARGIVHQDIKAPNVLLEEHPTKYVQAVITDFGISNVVEDKVLLVKAFEVKNMRGLTVKYAPPEAIIRFRSNDRCRLIPQVAKAGDVYSFSIVIHALLAKK